MPTIESLDLLDNKTRSLKSFIIPILIDYKIKTLTNRFRSIPNIDIEKMLQTVIILKLISVKIQVKYKFAYKFVYFINLYKTPNKNRTSFL